jgi:hypothetical protein
VFHMFDNLLLLANGRIMYQDTAAGVISYFGERGFPCPEYTNPSGTKIRRKKFLKSALCNGLYGKYIWVLTFQNFRVCVCVCLMCACVFVYFTRNANVRILVCVCVCVCVC